MYHILSFITKRMWIQKFNFYFSPSPDVDGRIILRWNFRKWEEVVGTGRSWLRIGTGGGHL
jgi:hypothetical protein